MHLDKNKCVAWKKKKNVKLIDPAFLSKVENTPEPTAELVCPKIAGTNTCCSADLYCVVEFWYHFIYALIDSLPDVQNIKQMEEAMGIVLKVMPRLEEETSKVHSNTWRHEKVVL